MKANSTRERANRSALLAFIGIPIVANLWLIVKIFWPTVVFLTLERPDKPPYPWLWYAFLWTLGQKLSPILLAWSAAINPGRQYTYIWLAAALYFILEALESLNTSPGYAKELMAPAYMLLCYLIFRLTPARPPDQHQHQEEE